VPEYVNFNLFTCSSTEADANEMVMADLTNDHTLSAAHQYPDAQPGRMGAVAVSSMGSAPNPLACITNASGGGGAPRAPFTKTIITASGGQVTVGGTTTLQLRVSNRGAWPSSPAPGGQNAVYLTGSAATQNYRPSMEVTWALPAPAPTQLGPGPGPTTTMTPVLSVRPESDPDGDPNVSYAFAVYNSPTINVSTQVWVTPHWQSATQATVPAGALAANTNYWWEACAWDNVDLVAECTGAWGPFTTPKNLPQPVLSSPANTANVLVSGLTLGANPVTDPNTGGVPTYVFTIAPNATLSGGTTSAPQASPTYTPSGLVAGTTYYWAVSAQDQYAMTSPQSAIWSFTPDNPPPAVSLTASIPPDPAWVSTSTVSVTWTDSDPVLAGYTWAFDHSPGTDPGMTNPGAATQTVQPVSAGVWYIHVRAANKAGAWSPVATLQFDIAPMSCATCTSAGLDGAGLKSFYPYQSFALGGPSTAYANLANGNLVVQTTPLHLAGMGLNLILQATYNLDRDPATAGATDTVAAGPLGPGWTLAISEGADASAGMADAPDMADVGRGLTATATNSFDFSDASGTHQVFFQDAAGWHSPRRASTSRCRRARTCSAPGTAWCAPTPWSTSTGRSRASASG